MSNYEQLNGTITIAEDEAQKLAEQLSQDPGLQAHLEVSIGEPKRQSRLRRDGSEVDITTVYFSQDELSVVIAWTSDGRGEVRIEVDENNHAVDYAQELILWSVIMRALKKSPTARGTLHYKTEYSDYSTEWATFGGAR